MAGKTSRASDVLFIGSLVLFCMVLVIGVLINLAPHLGWVVDGVRSGSMTPAIPRGALVIGKPATINNVELGDVVIYRSDSAKENYICHRVVAVNLTTPTTLDVKGDANPYPDPRAVDGSHLVALVVWNLPVFGFPAIFIKTALGFIVTVILPGLFVASLCLLKLNSELFSRKRAASK